MLYNNGIATAKNPQWAFLWFIRASGGGEPLGSYKVGCYYAGQFPGVVPVDADRALAFKLVAAQAGYVLAQHDVAIAYGRRGGLGEAMKWWRAAAAQGDVGGLLTLADAHRSGVGAELNPAKSYEYLLVARRLGPDAQARVAAPILEESRKGLAAAEIAQAEAAAASWKPTLTALSLRARLGIEGARRAVQ
jgi:TPR repeat protein